MVEKEKRFFSKDGLSERIVKARLKSATKIVTGSHLDKLLGLEGDNEVAYLVATLAWDISRKKGHQTQFLVNHPAAETSQRMGSAFGLVGRACHLLNDINIQATSVLRETKENLARKQPQLGPVFGVIDRASNLIAAELVLSEQEGLGFKPTLEKLEPVTSRFRGEMSSARKLVTPPGFEPGYRG